MRPTQIAALVEQVESSDQSDAATRPLEAFVDFLTSEPPDIEEPPRKRRGFRFTHRPQWTNGVRRTEPSVVLSQVTLDLRFKDEETLVGQECEDSAPEIPVLLWHFETISANVISFKLSPGSLPRGSYHHLRLRCNVSSHDRIRRPLGYISRSFSSGLAETSQDSHYSDCVLIPPNRGRPYYQLRAQLRWIIGSSPLYTQRKLVQSYQLQEANLLRFLTDDNDEAGAPWSLDDFYKLIHVPSKDIAIPETIGKCLPKVTFYPFQTRAVNWLLHREGVRYRNNTLEVVEKDELSQGDLPVSFTEAVDATGQQCYLSHVHGLVATDSRLLGQHRVSLKGGILAEEMGLGKTVELIALISLHRRRIAETTILDLYSGATLRTSGATLIVSPPNIWEQWKSEINTHAPDLSVYEYRGIPSFHASEDEQWNASVDHLLQYDVVLTTYNVLSKEIHYADILPDRNLRHAKKYEVRRSPLVEISWWRVCMDEAQMVENGVSNAATVARKIPRINAWAVSGTPFKKDVQDLRGLLSFLRFEPYASNKTLWDRVDKFTFRQIFGTIAMRHTKEKLHGELKLPPQKRVVITVPFTPIEEQNYTELFKQLCDDCEVNLDGSPSTDDWNPNDPRLIERMRRWLARLRQTCLHPQVGGRNRRALGRGNGPLRTVEEVLQVMIDQNETAVRAAEREHLLTMLNRGHIWANAKSLKDRAQKGLGIYLDALKESTKAVDECRKELDDEIKKAKQNIAEPTRVKAEQDADDEQNPEKAGGVQARRAGLRHALEVHHACLFFVATAYFQLRSNEDLTEPDSERFQELEKLESEYYEEAKVVRKELLQDSRARAEEYMQRIKDRVKQFPRVQAITELDGHGGIENRKVLAKLDWLTDTMNGQAELINEWRKKVVEILLLPFVDQDEKGKDITGEEYEDSTKVQDELYVYVLALRAIVADRHHAVTGQYNVLVNDETKRASKSAGDVLYGEKLADFPQGDVHAPELTLKLLKKRDQFKSDIKELRSLRAAVSELRTLETNLQYQTEDRNTRAAAELLLIRQFLAMVQGVATSEMKQLSNLENDLELFRTTMNYRLEFYRQLQHISDTVAPYKEEMDEELDEAALERHAQVEQKTEKKLAESRTKRRFLLHLRDESSEQVGPRICVICQGDFELGVLTVCGHQYCKDCIRHWWNQHHTCPICKRHLRLVDFHEITYKPQGLKVQEETHSQGESSNGLPAKNDSPTSTHTSIYSDMNNKVMDEIKSIELNGSYGTKIDAIVRHILWIRHNDPGSKSIIFSQFSDFLNVLADSFNRFKVGFSRITKKGGIEKFRNDPSIECFLLDAKSDSSGLNLVNATHVFLCEPLINTAIELQAIARVHRIGQHRPTAVYMYLVSDTVEEAIYDISVSRRLAHVGRRGQASTTASSRSGTATPLAKELQESAIDAANSLEMQKAPISKLLERGKNEGELVSTEDLWRCLFGKARGLGKAGAPGVVSELVERQVGRHLRAEAAETRMRIG